MLLPDQDRLFFRCQMPTHQVSPTYVLVPYQNTYCACSCRCLTHIINLATQTVISTRSKSKYYNGDPDDEHVPKDLGATEHDEIGIVCAICVKVRSSAQCKEAFKAIQYHHKLPPLQLLLDIKVQWSSTFIMLTCAELQ